MQCCFRNFCMWNIQLEEELYIGTERVSCTLEKEAERYTLEREGETCTFSHSLPFASYQVNEEMRYAEHVGR